MSEALPGAKNYHDWVLSLFSPYTTGKSVLEIGPGYGQYTRALSPQSASWMVADISQECVDEAVAVSGKVRGVIARLGSEEFSEAVGLGKYDIALCSNVLEHIEDDRFALESIFATLRPGGKILVFTPAFQELYGQMDSLAGHFRRYTRRGLESVLVDAGFKVECSRYFNPVGGLGWWANSIFRKPRHLSTGGINRQIMFFDKYVVPFSRLVDCMTRLFFGQSVWAVASKQ